MKRLSFLIVCLLFITSPLLGGEGTHIDRGHNQIEIEGLQSIDISPVLEMPTAGTVDMTSTEDGVVFHVSKKPILTLRDFANAKVSNKEGVVSLNLGLTDSGGKRIKEFSAKNVGKKLAFVVNGKLLKAPKIRVPIDAGGLSIDPIEKPMAEKLAMLINKRAK